MCLSSRDRKVRYAVGNRTSLHAPTPKKGILQKSNGDFPQKFECWFRIWEREGLPDGSKNSHGRLIGQHRETGHCGWGARIRTWEWRNQNPTVSLLVSARILKKSRNPSHYCSIG